MKYEIIRHISKIKEWNSVSIQFNEVKWYNGKPKYDLRKWEDGEPKKGITLEREDLETLYIALGRELGYEQHDKKETEEIPFINNSVEENVEELMDYRNFIVYGAYEDCMKKGHNCQDITVIVPYYYNGKVKEIKLPARKCKTCKKYYISNYQYNTLMKKGRILCQIVSKKEYEEYSKEQEAGGLSEQSILKIVGYTVNSNDDYSDDYRHNVLKYAIAEEIFTKEKAIRHISWLIKLNENKSNMEESVKKWRSDRDYLRGYNEKNHYMEYINLFATKNIITLKLFEISL